MQRLAVRPSSIVVGVFNTPGRSGFVTIRPPVSFMAVLTSSYSRSSRKPGKKTGLEAAAHGFDGL